MKRIKRVFRSHSEVTHVWAQQKQESGRASRIFFENTTDLYSYGHHYLMAKVHTVKGKRFALVNSYKYSQSTAGHLSCTRSALDGLMPYFEVSHLRDPKAAVKELDDRVQSAVDAAMKRRCFVGVWYRAPGSWELTAIKDAHKEANQLRKLIGLKALKFPEKEYEAAVAHIHKLRKAWKLREAKKNTPEEIERRTREKQRREELKQKKEGERLAEEIQKFRRGEYFRDIRLPWDLLRVQGEQVQTSRGAWVPLNEARLILRALESGKKVSGQAVGGYTVTGIETLDNDKLIKIGCHRILLSEARNVLASARKLALVTA